MDLKSAYAAELRGQLVARGLVEGRDFLFESFLGDNRFQQLVDLYSAADFYLELSLHEGFGMQLVEAMACGTTCISSSRGALPEIGNKYVRFVDPLDIESVSSAIAKAYAESAHERNNAEQVKYTRKFSWDETSKVVCAVLMRVAATHAGSRRPETISSGK
jgi:glycosyltransferase involved in cell wall biosynthesis